MNVTSILDLNTLGKGIPALTQRKAATHMEACVWCFTECGHGSGVTLSIITDNNGSDSCQVIWDNRQIEIEALYRAYNKDDAPEQGAEAIAFLLIREKTNYTAIHRAVTRTGIDYWLGFKEVVNGQIFTLRSGRLEVSGILQESPTNKPLYRVKSKLRQTHQSDSTGFPAYVVVVEFSKPLAHISYRNVEN